MISDFSNAPNMSLRQRVMLRFDELQQVRASRITDWTDLNDYILPRRMRHLYPNSDKSKSTRNKKIINGTATRAVHVLESGMMAGMTNPSRPWQRIIADPDLMKITRVQEWCGRAGPKVLEIYRRCNLYKGLPKFYGMGAVFGISCFYVEPDPVDLIRVYVLPVGSFMAANDEHGRVTTIYRQFDQTVLNAARQFGEESLSDHARSMLRARAYDKTITIIHAVEPRGEFDPSKRDPRNMPFASYWLEKDAQEKDGDRGFLRISGYRRFPFFTFRWDVTDDQNDAYGDGPGIDVIGDAMGLQLLERRKAQAVDKIVSPPMAGPGALKPTNMSLVPGGLTVVDTIQGGQQFKAALEINHQAPKSIGDEIREHELRIEKAFYCDLWLMLASSDRREITAREVDERHEEKMIQLGPVVDRLNDEVLDPLAEYTIARAIEAGELPVPPPELLGERGTRMNIRVDNISILAQAQKLVGTVGLERLAGFAGNYAAVDKRVLDNLDRDQLVRNYADMLGVDPSNLTDREKMAMERQALAEQERAAQIGEAMRPTKDAAQAAKVLSETDVGGEPMLDRLMGSIGAA